MRADADEAGYSIILPDIVLPDGPGALPEDGDPTRVAPELLDVCLHPKEMHKGEIKHSLDFWIERCH